MQGAEGRWAGQLTPPVSLSHRVPFHQVDRGVMAKEGDQGVGW